MIPFAKSFIHKFADELRDLAKRSSSFSIASLHVKVEVSLHLLLDLIHRGDQKRISEILALPIWDELNLMDPETTKFYEDIKKICLDQKELKTKEEALEFLKQKEQEVLKFFKYLRKWPA